MHQIESRDGMNVLVVNEMQRRYHPRTKKELPNRPFKDVIVHSSEIARFYGVPHQDIITPDGKLVPGVWRLVSENIIGQRVPYNNEGEIASDKSVRKWKTIFNETGLPIDTEEYIETVPTRVETDDGMYVRLSDLLVYAEANGWEKGKGRPKRAADTDPNIIVSQTVAAVMASLAPIFAKLGMSEERSMPVIPEHIDAANGTPKKRVWTEEERRAAGDRLRAAREAKRAGKSSN